MTTFTPVTTIGRINFTKNWNKKFYCKYFTTIRLPSNKYLVGFNYMIWCNNLFVTRAAIVDKKILPLKDIPDYTLMLDTGLPPQQAREQLLQIFGAAAAIGLEVIMCENLEVE